MLEVETNDQKIVPSSSSEKVQRFGLNDGTPDTCLQKVLQQRLSGTPVLFNATCGIFLFAALMMMFVGVGAVLWHFAADIVSYSFAYGPNDAVSQRPGDRAVWNKNVSVLSFTVSEHMAKPLQVQYRLSGFFQNHRRYRKSVSWSQLAGKNDASLESDCEFWYDDSAGRIWYPCGLIARSVFSDYFIIYKKEPNATTWTQVEIIHTQEKIIDSSLNVNKLFKEPPDIMTDANVSYWIYFQFPPEICVPDLTDREIEALTTGDAPSIQQVYVARNSSNQPDCNFSSDRTSGQCNFTTTFNGTNGLPCASLPGRHKSVKISDFGVRSPHFINWFYLAAFPTFRKLWGIIEEDIPKDTQLKVVISDNFDVASFEGKKNFVLTTTNWMGTPDSNIAIAYFTTAGFCLLATLYLSYIWVKRPRMESSIALDFVQPS